MKIVQVVPKAQVEILLEALAIYEVMLKGLDIESDNLDHKKFDILVLKGLLKSEVKIELTELDYEYFTSNNGVDFPQYTK